MTEQPNIQKEILEYVKEQYEQQEGVPTAVNLREFAAENDYSPRRVARKAGETGALDCGINMLHPWPRGHDISNVEEKLEEWE